VSPEYSQDSIVFRMKAPDAQKVELECEILPDNLAMTKDADGVWTVVLSDFVTETFKYCFIVDGTRVADPQNMYLSPDRGFKYSIADNPYGPFSLAKMGDIPHGRTGYDLNRGEAWYMSPMTGQPAMPVMIQLVPGRNDTMESWFKVGGADAIADRLLADGNTRPCVITTSTLDFMQQSPMQQSAMKPHVLRADDYPTWAQRRRALVRLLVKIGKEPAPSFPDFGGAGGAPGGF
jgi:hypothetical protein